jgi:hypothetical protein
VDALTLVSLLLTTARLTRLVTADRITEKYRVAIISRVSPEGLLAYLIVCDWCASFYIGAAVSGAWWAFGDYEWFELVTLALSASYVAGFLNSKVDD